MWMKGIQWRQNRVESLFDGTIKKKEKFVVETSTLTTVISSTLE